MKASNTASKLITLVSALLFVQGCAIAPREPLVSAPNLVTQPEVSEIVHRVRPHERLGDIAILYTGNATNWEKIARYNSISNPRKLRIGAMITIPNSLVSQQNLQKLATTKQELQLVAASRPNATTATTNSLAVKRGIPQKSSVVVIESVKTNRAFKLSPIKQSNLINQAQSKAPALRVQIVGSYYPKGIYRQPANYSTLVMRAAPGTLFELEHLANDWYKIVTENGIGYLREDDGKVVPLNVQL